MSKMRRNLRILCIGASALAGCAMNEPAPVVDMSLPSGTPATYAAVAAPVSGGTYRVVRGDTLYAIAFKHGVDYRDLAAWNGIAAPYTIFTGQELHLSAPARVESVAPAAPVAVAAKTNTPPSEPTPGEAVTSGISERSTAATATSAFEDVPLPPAVPPSTPAAATVASSKPVEAQAPVVAPGPAKPTAELAKPASAATVAAAAAAPKPVAAKPPVAEAVHTDNTPELSSGGVTWRWPNNGRVIGTYVSGEPTKQGIDIGGKSGDPVHAAADGEVVYSGNGLIGYGELIIVKHNANFLSAYGHNRSRLVREGEKVKAGQAIAEMGASASSRDELHFEIRKNGKPVNPMEYLPAR